MNKWTIGIIFFVIAVGLAVCWQFGSLQHISAQLLNSVPPLRSAQLLPAPKALPDIKLEKNKGDPFTIANFKDHWSLVFFGFTSCPDFCPVELQKLSTVLSLAQKNNQQKIPLQVIFISLDPERDSPEKIKAYTAFFHPQIQGIRGSNPELAKVAQVFGSDYRRHVVSAGTALIIPAGIDMPAKVDNEYTVDHSARIYIVNPRAEYVGSFAPPHNTENILADVQVLMGK